MSRALTAAAPALLFGAVAVVFTWPIGNLRDPGLPNHNDALFSVWRLAWVAHQLRNDPRELFDGNIFWPEPNTLAMSDAMLLLGAAGAPLIWSGVHPVVVHNVWLIASFAAAGYAAMRLLAFLGAPTAAQMVGGVIFAFAPYRVAHLGHLELLWTAFIPLTLLCLYRALERPTIGRGTALGLVLALQAFSSIYYFVFLCIWLAPALALAPLHIQIAWSKRHVVPAAAAAGIVAMLVAPYAAVYMDVRQTVDGRTYEEVARYSATPGDYFNIPAANRVYPAAPAGDVADERTLYVGGVALVLAALALWRRTSRAIIPFAVLGVIALDLSFGVNGVLFNALRAIAPALDGLRAPARFGVFVLLSVAVLAGLAVTSLRAARRHAVAVVLAAAMLIEYWSAPVATLKLPMEAPLVYQWLARQPRTVTLEWPAPTPDALWKHETLYQYFSIYHWQPLVNGYSGYVPPPYAMMLERLRDFPSEGALQALVRNHVDVLLIHERFVEPNEFARLLLTCGDTRYFRELIVLEDPVTGRSAACRLAPSAPAP